MEVVIQLNTESAHELQHHQPPGDATQELMGVAEEHNLALEPIHPQIADPELATYFYVHVTDDEDAERVRESLSRCRCVEAAYIKPTDALP